MTTGTRSNIRGDCVQSAILCRDSQCEQLQETLSASWKNKHGGVICISGRPGTGKTSSVCHILSKIHQTELKWIYVNVSSMSSCGSSADFFQHVLQLCKQAKSGDTQHAPKKQAEHDLEQLFCGCCDQPNFSPPKKCGRRGSPFKSAAKDMWVLVLDDVNTHTNRKPNKRSKSTPVDKLLSWAGTPSSRLTCIAISNSPTFTDTLFATLKGKLRRIDYPPYTPSELKDIAIAHFGKHEDLNEKALLLIAKRVGGKDGDARKMLDQCSTANLLHNYTHNTHNHGTSLKSSHLQHRNCVNIDDDDIIDVSTPSHVTHTPSHTPTCGYTSSSCTKTPIAEIRRYASTHGSECSDTYTPKKLNLCLTPSSAAFSPMPSRALFRRLASPPSAKAERAEKHMNRSSENDVVPTIARPSNFDLKTHVKTRHQPPLRRSLNFDMQSAVEASKVGSDSVNIITNLPNHDKILLLTATLMITRNVNGADNTLAILSKNFSKLTAHCGSPLTMYDEKEIEEQVWGMCRTLEDYGLLKLVNEATKHGARQRRTTVKLVVAKEHVKTALEKDLLLQNFISTL